MDFKIAKPHHLDSIQQLFHLARHQMKMMGNESQWGEEYPSTSLIMNDIEKKQCYIAVDNSEIVGVFSCISGNDPTYEHIYQGKWLNDKPYITIHRIASSGKVAGLTSQLIQFCFALHPNIRIDTHRDNAAMLHILAKEGFHYCGNILLEDHSERLAYQKTK